MDAAEAAPILKVYESFRPFEMAKPDFSRAKRLRMVQPVPRIPANSIPKPKEGKGRKALVLLAVQFF